MTTDPSKRIHTELFFISIPTSVEALTNSEPSNKNNGGKKHESDGDDDLQMMMPVTSSSSLPQAHLLEGKIMEFLTTLIPDGSRPFFIRDQCATLITFTCGKASVDKHLERLRELGIGGPQSPSEVTVLPLSVYKDYRSSAGVHDSPLSPVLPQSQVSNPALPPRGSLGSSSSSSSIAPAEPTTSASNTTTVALETALSSSTDNPPEASPPPSAIARPPPPPPSHKGFKSSIKTRIAVENMYLGILSGATLTFDFVMLILVAACLALIGLVIDSPVIIVSAMLVSPMMGPILGLTFGSMVEDRELIRTSLVTEVVALVLCTTVGFLGGLCAAPFSMRQTPWPTPEMSNRGSVEGLYTGAAIAAVSGVGVALSVTGQNTSSFVGIAISASLLPPVVNFGLLLAEACLIDSYFASACVDGGTVDWSTCCGAGGPGCALASGAFFPLLIK